MKKLDAVAINKVNIYFSKNSVSSLNIVELIQTINSGKNRYDYFCLLDYLISASISLLETNPSNLKKLDKYLTLISQIASVDRGDFEHDEVTLSRYVALPEAIKTYFANKGEELDQSLYDSVVKIGKSLGVTFEEVKSDDRLSARLVELSDQVDRLKKENDSISRQLADALKQLKKLNSSSENLKDTISASARENLLRINDLNNRIKELQDQITSLNLTIADKERIVSELQMAIEEKEQIIKELTKSLAAVNAEKDNLAKTYQQIILSRPYILGQSAVLDEKIDSIVLESISKKRCTANELWDDVKKVMPNVLLNDIYASLRRISCRYNIQNPRMITVPETYGIGKPILPEDKTIILPTTGDTKKLILLSDMHISQKEDNSYLYGKMDYLHSYAYENGIDTFIDLGDFFDTDGRLFPTSLKPQNAYKRVSDISENLGAQNFLSPDFNYVLLGGNHDADIADYGFDPIKVLKEGNPSVIPAGYRNATLKIGNSKLGIHHEGAPRQDQYNPKDFSQQVVNFLKNYYKGREGAFFDFFGHIHTSVIDGANGYACVPSFDRDRNFDGMFEINVHLDSNNDIDYMVIYPLASYYNRDVRKTSEIPIIR